MSSRDWDKELAKIDKQMSSMSDADLVSNTVAPSGPAARNAPVSPSASASVSKSPTSLGVVLRVTLAVALAVGILFWPYSARCGLGLAGYLASVTAVMAGGTWASIATWRARSARMHIVALLVIASGIAFAAVEVLPRIGYASDPARSGWMCK